MGPETVNRNKDCEFHGDYVGRDQHVTNIIMFQESEREFIVTHNANIKTVSYFTGRETELKDLRKWIEAGRKSVLVSGMGGIGKTQICRKLFEEYSDRHENGFFQHIGYIEYNGGIDSSLQRCLKFKKQGDPEQNHEAAWRELEYLAADEKLLLFVDNVNVSIGEDPNLKRLMSIPGAIVLTSRRRVFSKEFEPYRIEFLSTKKCREIYEKIRFENSGKKVAEEEVSDLEYVIDTLAAQHTITIEFLAHLARTNNWTVKKLREELEKNGFRLEYMDEEDKLVNIQKSYETLYDMSVLTEAEQNILEAFSIFPYTPLKAEICNQWLLADAGVGEEDYVLMKLYRKGWMQFDMEQESYALHPVFSQFIYEKNSPEFEKHAGFIKSCTRYLEIPENGSPLECQQYVPFAENVIKKVNMGDGLEQVEIIAALAYLLQYIAEYRKAQKLYEKALAISERVLGEEHPSTATSYNNLAYVYESQGEYGKAEGLYEKALAIRERVLGEEHPDTATSYNNLAGVYESQGEYGKAEGLYEKALAISERVLGEEHPSTATSYNNLAGVYAYQGNNEEALSYYLKAYRIYMLRLGKKHPNTQIVHGNVKIAYSEWNPDGDFEQWLEEQMKEPEYN